MASSVNSKGFFRKIRTACSVILCQKSYNVHGTYLAIKEFSGGGRWGLFCSLKVERTGVGVALGRCFVSCCNLISPWNSFPRHFMETPALASQPLRQLRLLKPHALLPLVLRRAQIQRIYMAIGKFSRTNPVTALHIYSQYRTGSQFPPASHDLPCDGMPSTQSVWCAKTPFIPATLGGAIGSGAMSSLKAASMADGQNIRTKPEPDVRTKKTNTCWNQRWHKDKRGRQRGRCRTLVSRGKFTLREMIFAYYLYIFCTLFF
jgi:hypothetical protein